MGAPPHAKMMSRTLSEPHSTHKLSSSSSNRGRFLDISEIHSQISSRESGQGLGHRTQKWSLMRLAFSLKSFSWYLSGNAREKRSAFSCSVTRPILPKIKSNFPWKVRRSLKVNSFKCRRDKNSHSRRCRSASSRAYVRCNSCQNSTSVRSELSSCRDWSLRRETSSKLPCKALKSRTSLTSSPAISRRTETYCSHSLENVYQSSSRPENFGGGQDEARDAKRGYTQPTHQLPKGGWCAGADHVDTFGGRFPQNFAQCTQTQLLIGISV